MLSCMHNWARALAPTHFLSLATNADVAGPHGNTHRVEWINRKIYSLAGRVDRNLIGSTWQKRPDKRLRGFGTIEHIETNIHAHLLLRLNADYDTSNIEFHIGNQWARLMPAGSVDLKDVHYLSGFVNYTFKDVFQGNFSERLVEIAPV